MGTANPLTRWKHRRWKNRLLAAARRLLRRHAEAAPPAPPTLAPDVRVEVENRLPPSWPLPYSPTSLNADAALKTLLNLDHTNAIRH